MITPAELMQLAIEKCRQGIAVGQSPFGCAIAVGEQVIAVAHNTVLLTTDITAHAEINALREGCRQQGDVHLPGAMVATTCEPCPMCMAALHWAQVATVYYGATIADATGGGFNELSIPATEIVRLGSSPVRLEPNLLRDECQALFQEWQQGPAAKVY